MFDGARRRLALGLIVASVLFGGTYLAARHGGAGHLHIQGTDRATIAPGAELLRARLYRGAADAGQLIVLFLDPKTVRLELVVNPDRKKLTQLAPGAQLVMNASYFTPEYRPTGLLVSQGEVLSAFVGKGGPAGSGVLLLEDHRVQLLRREDIKNRSFEGAALAIQAGPRLIEADGTRGIRSDDGQHANRSFIGADKRGWLVLGVVYRADGGLGGGPSLFELQRLLLRLEPGAEGLAFALNLDGGPSTGLILRAKPALQMSESATVYSALAVRAKWP